ncbi:MAG: lamin tail domain-containing protein [Myxococcota bacterium]
MLALGWWACTQWRSPVDGGADGEKIEDGQSLDLVWSAVPATSHPPCESGLAVYDAARGEVLYVGNGGVSQQPWLKCNETWTWDGADWVKRADTAHGPTWLLDASLAYDPVRERVVLFGGEKLGGRQLAAANEVWEWDGVEWTNRTPAAAALQPPPMAEPGLQFDPVSERMLAFGGSSHTVYLDDVWSWDGAAWQKVADTGPWTLRHTTWDGGALVGMGDGTPGFAGWSRMSWDGAAWSDTGPTPFAGPAWIVHDPSPGVTLASSDAAELYWDGPDGFERRAARGDPFPSSYWGDSFFVYDPARDRVVVWNVGWGDTVMELEALAIADAPPAFVDPPDTLTYSVGYEDRKFLSATSPDGDPVTLTLEHELSTPWPVLVSYPPTGWSLRWEPEPDQIGEHTVTLVLSDGVNEVRHDVQLVAGYRELPGFPLGSFESTGSGSARIGDEPTDYGTPVDLSCSLTVDNPGTAELGCSATFPFWIERSNEPGESFPTYTLVDRILLGSGTQSFVFEEWGVSTQPLPLGDPWTWATGSITETADGYLVQVWPALPKGLSTSLGPLPAALYTLSLDPVELWKPNLPGVGSLSPGDLVITEIMRNPAAVSDSVGEWFELQNVSGGDIDLDGLEIWDADTDHDVVGGPLVVPDGGVVVFAVSADPAANGGVAADVTLPDQVLANSADELYVGVGSLVLDAVEWGAGWPAPNGASITLGAGGTAASNDAPSGWTASTATYGAGDRGTPGAR